MSCETQNVDVTFNDTTAQSLAFDDATALSLAFDDVVNQNIQCSKFEAPVFAPEDVLFEYFEADDLGAGDGSAVSSWAGRNGEATLTQNTSSARPTYRASTGGASLPGVEFDAVDDYLIAHSLASLFAKLGAASGHPEFTVFAVLSGGLFSTADWVWSAGFSASNTPFCGFQNAPSPLLWIRNDSGGTNMQEATSAARRDTDATVIQRVTESDNTFDFWLGNTQDTADGAVTPSTNKNTYDRFAVGALARTGFSQFGGFKLHAFGVSGTPLSDGDIASLQSYASDKWGY